MRQQSGIHHVVEEAMAAAVKRSLTAAVGRAVEFGACDDKDFGSSAEPRLERVEVGQRVYSRFCFIRFYYFLALHNNIHF